MACAFTVNASPLYAQVLSADIDRYEVIGNTLLDATQVQQLLQGLTGKVDMARINQAAERLQTRYREAGYGAVVVQVPQQTLTGSTVRLEVIEGDLSQIQVAGLNQFSRVNILRSLPSLRLHTTPRLSELDGELLMANENPAKAVRVVFQPGEKKGQVEALVAVQEQPITRWTLGLDNSGNEATGNYRTSLAFQHANVNDADAVLGLRLLTSPTDPERVSIVSATYRVPLYAQKVFWEWSALSSNTVNAPNQTPAGELRFSGQGNSFGGRALWTLPSLSEFKQQASIGLESRQYKNTCTLGSFGTAGCGSAAASVDVFPLTLGYALQQSGVMSATLQWIGNMQVDNAGNSGAYNAARAGAVSDYQLMRFNSLGRLPLGRALELSWRADAQWSQQALVSAEQFGVGGASSVRGYPERVLSGDSGALVSLEFDMPLGQDAATGGADTSMQLSGYLDAAMVRNERDTACLAGLSNCSLWGSGMGLAIRYGKHLTSRMDLARAGQMVNTTQAGDWRLHFSVNYQY